MGGEFFGLPDYEGLDKSAELKAPEAAPVNADGKNPRDTPGLAPHASHRKPSGNT